MQDHNREGASYVTDLQLVRALPSTSDEEFFALIEAVSNGNGNTEDPHILDKALLLTVSRYKNSLRHDSMWMTAAEKLIDRGAKIDHAEMGKIWQEVKEDQFRDTSFAQGYREMEAVLKKAEQLDYTLTLPTIYAKPFRPVRAKPASVNRPQQQPQGSQPEDVAESSSATIPASKINMGWLATVLKANLGIVIRSESKIVETVWLTRVVVEN